jgi:hypothetical protein
MAFALAAATPPPHQPPGAMTIACVVFIGCMLLFSIGCAIRFRRMELRSLRRCPSCSHDAVRALEPAEGGDPIHVEVQIECGACGARRRVKTTRADLRAFDQRLERHRRAIGSSEEGMHRARERRDCDAFARALREEIMGADDFLERARAEGRRSLPG